MYMKVLRNSLPLLGLSSILRPGGISLKMPGKSYEGKLPPLGEDAGLLHGLRRHVEKLSVEIGERNLTCFNGLKFSVEYIAEEFSKLDGELSFQDYTVPAGSLKKHWDKYRYSYQKYQNIILEFPGREKPDDIIVIGAHYDSVPIAGCRAANDNASGVAAVIELARYFSGLNNKRTIRFVAFANEEPPFFWTRYMGSYVYAKRCKELDENIIAMITPETIGYYSDREGSQRYPLPLKWFYPSKGNFIAFVGNSSSSNLVKNCVEIFREKEKFPCEGACLPMIVPRIGSSDHWAFWRMGYPALMVTDTAPYRYKQYHTLSDNIDNISFDKMARVVRGLGKVIEELAG